MKDINISWLLRIVTEEFVTVDVKKKYGNVSLKKTVNLNKIYYDHLDL